jgi:GDP-4-dehydro-6-deoxy-D-mannose reductase
VRYLITGITGFVGPHLAKLLLRDGHEVAGLVRASNGREADIRDVLPDSVYEKIRFHYGDLTNRPSLERLLRAERFDGVFHLGAQSHPPTSFADPEGTFDANTTGTISLVELLALHQPECRLLFCSTSEVYGAPRREDGAIDESFRISPVNPYGVSKAAADMYVRERASSKKLPYFVTRAFSHTGPRRGRQFSISSDAYQLIRIKKGLQEPLLRVGTLSSERVVMDVRDCARAYALLMKTAQGAEAYNVGGDDLHSMADFLDDMLALTGLTGKVDKVVDPKLVRPIDIPVQICNSQKCRTLTGWAPEIGRKKMLQDLLDYWDRKIQA